MECFFQGINEQSSSSERLFAHQDIQRCPFLRNINEPTNFSLSPINFSKPVSYLLLSLLSVESLGITCSISVPACMCQNDVELGFSFVDYVKFLCFASDESLNLDYVFLCHLSSLSRYGVAKAPFSKMAPILTWHLGFSMAVMELFHSLEKHFYTLRICSLGPHLSSTL